MGIFLILLFTIIAAIVDGQLINNKIYIFDHTSRWVYRSIIFSLFIIHSFYWVIGAALFFTATFDQILNYIIDKPFWYLGNTSKWDKFWKKHKKYYKIIKLLFLIISIILFII